MCWAKEYLALDFRAPRKLGAGIFRDDTIWVCLYIHGHTRTHICIYICIHMYIYEDICMHKRTYICKRAGPILDHHHVSAGKPTEPWTW